MENYQGLSTSESERLLKLHGLNELPKKEGFSRLGLLSHQFESPLIYILVIAGLITLFLKEYADSLAISLAVICNTILGYYQESKAEKALQALSSMIQPYSRVIRDGVRKKIASKFLVEGDIVELSQGDKIPADGQIVSTISLSMNEAFLTGESNSVIKKVDDEVFMGSIVIAGRGIMCITKTGAQTRMGSIASELSTIKDAPTPIQIKIQKLAKTMGLLVVGLCILIFGLGVATGRPIVEMYTTSTAVAVAAIPEGLAISLTVILALGMQKIYKRKALVKKLIAAETLGSVTIIATDKTGTLTEGTMKVQFEQFENMNDAIAICALTNNLDDPIESALWEWVQKQGQDPEKLQKKHKRIQEIPFTSELKYMTVTFDDVEYMKGAPEVVLNKCNVDETKKKELLSVLHQKSHDGLRCIGLAKKTPHQKHYTWVGMMGMVDPVRKDLTKVFETADRAGIRIMMITGDVEGTAIAVWKSIRPGAGEPKVFHGDKVEKLSMAEMQKVVQTTDIFFRTSPLGKLHIVEALKKNKEVIALLGDGVNDAPALKSAHVGIVVNDASDVAKETADMILLDSNFNTIISAIEEGRNIFQNMKKVTLYLLSDSFTEIFLVLGSLLLGLPIPLTAAQMLWINVITDGLPAIALSSEARDSGILKQKPSPVSSPIIDRQLKILIGIVSVSTAVTSLVLFMYFNALGNVQLARTITFSALGIATLFYIFSTRSLTRSFISTPLFSNRFLLVSVCIGFLLQIAAVSFSTFRIMLKTTILTMQHWVIVCVYAIAIFLLIELIKYILRIQSEKVSIAPSNVEKLR